jgi:hypothetical protein
MRSNAYSCELIFRPGVSVRFYRRRNRDKPPQPPAGPRRLPQTLAQPHAGRPRLWLRRGAPLHVANTRSLESLPARWSASGSTSKRGMGRTAPRETLACATRSAAVDLLIASATVMRRR